MIGFSPLAVYPNKLCGPPSLIFNGYWVLLPQGMKLTTYFCVVLRLRMHGTIPPLLHMSL
jgi:hypothetical protein